MNSRPLLLFHDHKIEQVQQVEEFTIKLNMNIVKHDSESTEQSFSFKLEEFINEDPTTETLEEFYNFLSESVDDDAARSMFLNVVSFADNVRNIVGPDLRAVLSLSLSVLVPNPVELNDGGMIHEAFGEPFDGTMIGFVPASKLVIDSLSRRRFEKRGREDEKCTVCLRVFAVGAKVASLPCDHEFHDRCIVKWLETSHVCPLCRFELPCEPDANPEQHT